MCNKSYVDCNLKYHLHQLLINIFVMSTVYIGEFHKTVLCLISWISNFEPNPWMELNQISPAPNICLLWWLSSIISTKVPLVFCPQDWNLKLNAMPALCRKLTKFWSLKNFVQACCTVHNLHLPPEVIKTKKIVDKQGSFWFLLCWLLYKLINIFALLCF